MKKLVVLFGTLFLTYIVLAQGSDSESSSSVSGGDAALSVERTPEKKAKKKSKPNFRVKGNFKATDPMAAPDGQSQLQPTDGSRPKSGP